MQESLLVTPAATAPGHCGGCAIYQTCGTLCGIRGGIHLSQFGIVVVIVVVVSGGIGGTVVLQQP